MIRSLACREKLVEKSRPHAPQLYVHLLAQESQDKCPQYIHSDRHIVHWFICYEDIIRITLDSLLRYGDMVTLEASALDQRPLGQVRGNQTGF